MLLGLAFQFELERHTLILPSGLSFLEPFRMHFGCLFKHILAVVHCMHQIRAARQP